MPKAAQEVTIYEVRRPLKRFFEQAQTSPDLQHAALIIEKLHKNRHIAYLLEADLGSILKFDIVAEAPEHGTVQSLMKEHGFEIIVGKHTFVSPKKITIFTVRQIVSQFNDLKLQYYPFGYSAHPIQHGNETYGINCFGFTEHVLIQLGLKTYAKDDVNVTENPLEPHAQQLKPVWAVFYQLLGGKEMPSFKPPDGSMEKPV